MECYVISKKNGVYFYVHKVKQDSVHIVDDATLV